MTSSTKNSGRRPYSAREYKAILTAYHSAISRLDAPSLLRRKKTGRSTSEGAGPSDEDVVRLGEESISLRQRSVVPPKPKRGRPKGSGLRDDELIAEGLRMLAEREATSDNDAAKQLAKKAKGHSYEAKVDRLRKKIGAARRAALEKK